MGRIKLEISQIYVFDTRISTTKPIVRRIVCVCAHATCLFGTKTFYFNRGGERIIGVGIDGWLFRVASEITGTDLVKSVPFNYYPQKNGPPFLTRLCLVVA